MKTAGDPNQHNSPPLPPPAWEEGDLPLLHAPLNQNNPKKWVPVCGGSFFLLPPVGEGEARAKPSLLVCFLLLFVMIFSRFRVVVPSLALAPPPRHPSFPPNDIQAVEEDYDEDFWFQALQLGAGKFIHIFALWMVGCLLFRFRPAPVPSGVRTPA